MRIFIAVDFSPEEKHAMQLVQEKLKKSGLIGNEIKEEQFHMTLSFIGEVAEDAVKKLKQIVGKISFRPFFITWDSVDYFKSGEDWISYLATKDTACVTQLAEMVRKTLVYKNIKIDSKKFVPHITLFRRVAEPKPLSLSAPIKVRVDSVQLMQSELTKEGVKYHSLYEKSLRE